MKLKVVKYKNYGLKNNNAGEIIEHKFYYSYYELNNGSIIELQFVQYIGPMTKEEDDYGFSYTNMTLKSGEELTYIFGQDFWEHWNTKPANHQIDNPQDPSKEEKECIRLFFDEHLKMNDLESEIVLVKPKKRIIKSLKKSLVSLGYSKEVKKRLKGLGIESRWDFINFDFDKGEDERILNDQKSFKDMYNDW